MKLIKISIELTIDEGDLLSYVGYVTENKDKIADYLNNKLYTDPEFFGDFGSENIELLGDFE